MTRAAILERTIDFDDVVRHIVSLEKENKELKEQNTNLIAMLKSEREVRVNDDYLKGICERDAEIDELKEQLECAEFGYNKANEWHYPSKGELPKEDKEYLVYMNDGTIDIQEITMDGDGHYYFNGISWAFNDLIAWRELPEPPKEEE